MRDIPIFPHVNNAYTIFSIRLLHVSEWDTCDDFMDLIMGDIPHRPLPQQLHRRGSRILQLEARCISDHLT